MQVVYTYKKLYYRVGPPFLRRRVQTLLGTPSIQWRGKLRPCISCSSTTRLALKHTAEPTASVLIDWQVSTRVYACIYVLSTAENKVYPQPIECCNSVQNLPWFHIMLHAGCALLILVDVACYGPIIFLGIQSMACWWPCFLYSNCWKCDEWQFCQLQFAVGFRNRNGLQTLAE
jgi:hypothetical protein